MKFREVNFDAIVGPTHHFGGLGVGNVASMQHHLQPSNPKQAALEGLRKAKLLSDLGVEQFVLPPPIRPRLDWLEKLGFQGAPKQLLKAAFHDSPRALSAAFSSSFMWAANAATVTPSCDAGDGKAHVTLANLLSSWHRGVEAEERLLDFQRVFLGQDWAQVHAALPSIFPLRDEGAANHMRLCDASGEQGFHVFVFGSDENHQEERRFLPRHTRAASEAIARSHNIAPEKAFFLLQHPEAIAAGCFHNDVIATSHENLLLQHELAFADNSENQREIERLEKSFSQATGQQLNRQIVSNAQMPIEDAVESYFFNSQIVRARAESDTSSEQSGGQLHLICPHQCEENSSAQALVQYFVQSDTCPIETAHFVKLNESMSNGGGPACVRLRMSLSADQIESLGTRYRLSPNLYESLIEKVEANYPDQLTLNLLSNEDAKNQATQASHAIRQLFSD